LGQAETVVQDHAIAAAHELDQKRKQEDIEATTEELEDDCKDAAEFEEEQHAKRCKYDPLLEF